MKDGENMGRQKKMSTGLMLTISFHSDYKAPKTDTSVFYATISIGIMDCDKTLF